MDVTSVDQIELQPAGFQNFKDWDPVNASGLHRYRIHPALHQPIGQGFQLNRKGAETTHPFFGPVGRDCRPNFQRAAVQGASIRMNSFQGDQILARLDFFLRHPYPP
jgi:hypothetical protein